MKLLAIRLGEQTTPAKSLVMTALIGVEDFRLAIAVDCLLHRIDALVLRCFGWGEVRGQGVRQSPRQYPATCPVQHGEQVYKATPHWNVGDACPELRRRVRRPHVV